MKRFGKVLLALGFLTLLLTTAGTFPTYAQDPDCDTTFCGPGLGGGLEILQPLLEGTGIGNEGTLIQAILFWVRILLILAGVLAFVAFVWAGFLYVTTFASEENAEKAKKIMIYAAIGIIVILISYVITSFLITATL